MTPRTAPDTGTIVLAIVDGRRMPLSTEHKMLLRVLDGRKRAIVTQWVSGARIRVTDLPYYDSPDDWYTVIVHADGYHDAGVYPVRLMAGKEVNTYLMLLP